MQLKPHTTLFYVKNVKISLSEFSTLKNYPTHIIYNIKYDIIININYSINKFIK